MAEASILDCKKYFEETSSSKFAEEWRQLTDADKAEIKQLVTAELRGQKG